MNTLYTSSSIVNLLRNVSPFVVPLQSRHVLLTTKSCFTRHYTTTNNITTRCLIAQPNSYLKKTSSCSVLRTSPSIVSSSLNRSFHHQHNLHYHSNHHLNTRRNPLICCCCTSLAPNPLHLVVPRNDLSTMTNTSYSIEERGARNSLDYRVYFKDAQGNAISPWHDIPLFADQSKKIYNMVVEIPRWTNAKMEIATAEPLNPIKQDVKKGALRYVRNPFPHKGYIWNYGAFPQTWEDPKHIDPATNAKGDNDPIDVLEIGQRVAARGEVLQVKILGTVALIDEGETDWKVLAINTADPLADQLNDIEDVEKLMPGLLRATVEWLKIYKIPDGKPANEFAFNGEAKNREFAEKVVEETAAFWKTLTGKESNDSGLDLKNTTLANGGSIKVDEAKPILEGKAASASVPELAIPDQSALDKSYFIKL